MKFSRLLYSTRFITAICAAIILLAVFFGLNQTSHQEANCFLIIYNYPAFPLLKLIFDPLRTDWQCFQARELSYFIDFIDARFIAWCIRHHIAHFYSLSAVMLLIASSGIIHASLKQLFPRSKAWTIALVPLFYTVCNLNNLSFFRSSKPVVSFGVLILFFTLAKIISTPRKYHQICACIPVMITLLLLPGFDRTGFISTALYSAVATGLLAAAAIPHLSRYTNLNSAHLKPLLILSISGVFSVLLSEIYNFYLAPEIIHHYNGYYPTYLYQRLPAGSYSNWLLGLFFLAENCGFTFTSYAEILPSGFGSFILLFMAVLTLKSAANNKRNKLLPWLFGIFLISAVFVCGIMAKRHPAILLKDVMYNNYFQPFLAFFTGFFAISALSITGIKVSRQIIAGLLIVSITARILLFAGVLPPPFAPDGISAFHRETTAATLKILNDPEMSKEQLIPFSSYQLIAFFRNDPEILPFELKSQESERLK